MMRLRCSEGANNQYTAQSVGVRSFIISENLASYCKSKTVLHFDSQCISRLALQQTHSMCPLKLCLNI